MRILATHHDYALLNALADTTATKVTVQLYMLHLPMGALHDPSPRLRLTVANVSFKERLLGSSTNN